VTRFGDTTPKPVVAVGEPWATLVPLLSETLATDGSLVALVPTVDDAVEAVSARIGRRS